MRRTALLSPLALVILVGCSAQTAVDVEAERAALMEADQAWADGYAASDDPAEAFVSNLVEDASLLPPGAPLAQGRDAVRAVINELESLPNFSVSWAPVAADVGSGGDLGYTRGTYQMSFDGEGGPVSIAGKYLTVWRKQADGSWMVTVDMFNADAQPGM